MRAAREVPYDDNHDNHHDWGSPNVSSFKGISVARGRSCSNYTGAEKGLLRGRGEIASETEAANSDTSRYGGGYRIGRI